MRDTPRPSRNRAYRHEDHGVLVGCDHDTLMPYAHSHCEIEMNRVSGGRSWYRFGGREVELQPGTLVVFSALTPHQIVRREEGAFNDWMDLPMPVVSQWGLPDTLMGRLMAGEVLADADPVRHAEDGPRWRRWEEDIASGSPRRLRVALLEARARLERLALEQERVARRANRRQPASSDLVVDMMHHLLGRFDQRVTLTEVAAAVGLHPNTAATRFKAETGETVMGFLNAHRIKHAKLQLAATEVPVVDVAVRSGFGSLSRFYEAFKLEEGVAPAAFRRAAQGACDEQLAAYRGTPG